MILIVTLWGCLVESIEWCILLFITLELQIGVLRGAYSHPDLCSSLHCHHLLPSLLIFIKHYHNS